MKSADALKNVSPKTRAQVEGAIEAYDKSRDKEIETLRREVELYRSLSTAGITAATFAHESTGNPIKSITIALRTIESRGKKELEGRYDTLFAKPVAIAARAAHDGGIIRAAKAHDGRMQ